MTDSLHVVVNALGEEVEYVLEEHRDEYGQPLDGAPVFVYRPLSLGEQAKLQDDMVRATVRADASEDEDQEIKVLSGTQERKVLLNNLMSVRSLYVRSGSGEEYELDMPEPRKHGAKYNGEFPERERAINMIHRPWRREIARAIMDDSRLPEAAEKN